MQLFNLKGVKHNSSVKYEEYDFLCRLEREKQITIFIVEKRENT